MNQSETTSAAGGGETGAALATTEDHLRSFASNCRVQGARVRLDLTEMPYIGSGSYDAETTRRIGEAVSAALAVPTAKGGTDWHGMAERPRSRSKVVALYDDGSGAVMLYVHDDGAIDCEGFDFEWPDNRFDRWAYLPAGVEFHCETGEEALTLPVEPPPAGGAGGGSGDLGALSAGAREAVLAVVRTAWALVDNTGHHDLLPLAINRDDWDELAARLTALKALLPAEELPADPPHAVAYFWPAEATPVLSAPTPDLGAQGEPVAWDRYTVLNADHRRRIQALGAAISLRDWFGAEKAHAEIRDAFDRPDIYDPTSTDNLRSQNRPAAWAYEYLASDGWQRALWWDCPSELLQYKSRPERYRKARPLGFLDEAPAAPRTGSGVSVDDLKTILNVWHQSTCYPNASDGELRICAEQILALIAQAPRDGGETQGGWRLVPEEPTEDMVQAGWIDKEDVDPDDIYRAMLAAAPTPPSGVETIRQDNTSGGL